MYCSVITLSSAAVTAMVGVALVGIAFSTDNWQHIGVNRLALADIAYQTNDTELKSALQSDLRYFDRVRGIFRVCFPHEEKPKLRKLYLNPIEEWCTNVDYHFDLLDRGIIPKRITYRAQIWFHLARSVVAAFVLYFMLTGIASVTGLLGCWGASGDHLISTATLLLLASLFGAAGMGFWHGAEFYETERVRDERLEFFLTWPEYLREATTFSIGWSYIVSWVGIGVTLVSSLLFSGAAICIRQELREIEERNMIMKIQMSNRPHQPMPMMPPPPVMNYYSAGYPVQSFEDISDPKFGKYKSVVKELEDAKL